LVDNLDNTGLSKIHKTKILEHEELIKNNHKMINLIDIENVINLMTINSISHINKGFRLYLEERKKTDNHFKTNVLKKMTEYGLDEEEIFNSFLFKYKTIHKISI
jgi:hypothetical protein